MIVYSRAIDCLSKWFDFDNSPFKYFTSLPLKSQIPTIDDLIKLQEILDITGDGDKFI